MSRLLLFEVSQNKARPGVGSKGGRSFRVEMDRATGLRLAFDPVGTGMAWCMIGQIEVTFLARKWSIPTESYDVRCSLDEEINLHRPADGECEG